MLQLCLPFFNRRVKPFVLASHETATAVVGAGVIGLCTAYQLAKESRRTTHRVIVVEAADDVFTNSSGTNTGILSEDEVQDDPISLGRYSYSEWERLGSNEGFRRACGYRENVNIKLSLGSGIGHDLIPDWVRIEADWDAAKQPKDGRTAIV